MCAEIENTFNLKKLILHGFNLVSFKTSKHLRASFSFLQEICYARNITSSISYETTRCCSALPCSPPSCLFRGSTWKLSTRVCKHTINLFSYSQKIKLQKSCKAVMMQTEFSPVLGCFLSLHTLPRSDAWQQSPAGAVSKAALQALPLLFVLLEFKNLSVPLFSKPNTKFNQQKIKQCQCILIQLKKR